METRGLYGLALFFVVVIGGFYYFSGKEQQVQDSHTQNLASQAEKIQVIQTNSQGQLHLTATIDRATQTMPLEQTQLYGIRGVMYQLGEKDLIFAASRSQADKGFKNVELFDNITLTRLADTQQSSLTFYTDYLRADTKTQQIETHTPVQIQSVQAHLNSQGLKADLTTGQYELNQIRGQYVPTQP